MSTVTTTNTQVAERVMTLKDVVELINADRVASGESKIQHSKAMVKVDDLTKQPGFGGVAKIDTPTYNPDGSFNKTIDTYHLTKKQAMAVGAKLDNKRLMMVIDKLEELSKPKTYEEVMRDALLLADQRVKELENKIEADSPKVVFAENVSSSKDSLLVREWAKAISTKEVKIGQNKAFTWLRENGCLMKSNEPYQRYIDNGYFEVIIRTTNTPQGVRENKTTKITGKGQVALAKKIIAALAGDK